MMILVNITNPAKPIGPVNASVTGMIDGNIDDQFLRRDIGGLLGVNQPGTYNILCIPTTLVKESDRAFTVEVVVEHSRLVVARSRRIWSDPDV